jgi:hypothetical protein
MKDQGVQGFRRGCGRKKLRVEVVRNLVKHRANQVVANNNNFAESAVA